MARIAIVTDWFAPRRGGIESQLEELARRLSGAGNHAGVITATPGSDSPREYEVRRLGVATLPSPPLAVSPRLIPALRRELSRGWDVVHAHVSVVSPVGWLGAIVARSLGLPVAVTFHSVLRGKAGLLRAVTALSRAGQARVAWSAVSSAVAAQAAWGLHGADVRILPNGIDLAFWRTAARSGTGELTFVSALRLHRKKRARQLVRAFAAAAAGLERPVRLVLAGDGPERRKLESTVARLRLDRGGCRVELRGWMSQDELRRLYAGADAFVMPSVHESFGIAALEARAAGLPVVARRSGSVEFLHHDVNALLSSSDEAFTADLRRAMTNASLRERLRSAADDLGRFDWAAVTARHLQEYERAIRLAASAGAAAASSR